MLLTSDRSRAIHSLGLRTIDAALRRQGFNNTRLPGRHPKVSLENEIKAFMHDDRQTIFGLQVGNDYWPDFVSQSFALRCDYPGAKIVAGGPAFEREQLRTAGGQLVPDAITVALTEHLADVVVSGYAAPFVEMVARHAGDQAATKLPGLYYLKDGQVVGHGRGRQPILDPEQDLVPYILIQEDNYAAIMLDNACNNACGFCCVNRGGLGFSQEMVKRTLKHIYQCYDQTKPAQLHFIDSNPFRRVNRFPLLDLFDQFDETHPNVRKLCYLDPATLTTPGALDLLARLVKHGFISFFLGRDTVDEEVAAKIGVNYKGEAKNQNTLNEEGKAIFGLIEGLGARPLWRGQPFKVTVAYIMTPFESKGSLLRMIGEMEKVERAKTTFVETGIRFHALAPYPGTPIRHWYLDLLKQPDDPHISMSKNAWKHSLGPAAQLLDLFNKERIYYMFEEDDKGFFDRLRQDHVEPAFG
ncbi:MAG: hypothetical protein ABIH56_02115 [Candidatus Margulisiibacteriota bacterium]